MSEDRQADGEREDGERKDGEREDREREDRRERRRFMLGVLFAVIFAFALLVAVPLAGVYTLNRWAGVTGGIDFWGPLLAIAVSVTSMSVSGIFVFMSFRIDRGVKSEARETVRTLLNESMETAFKEAGREAKVRFTKAKRFSDSKFKEMDKKLLCMAGEIEKKNKSIKTCFEEIDKTLKGIKSDVETQKVQLGKKLEAAGAEIENRFTAEAPKVTEAFAGVYDLIKALRQQILELDLQGESGDGTATLNWTAGPDPRFAELRWQYQMREENGEYGGWVDLPPEAVSTREFVVDGLTNDRPYFFRVRVVSDDSAPSNERRVTPTAPPPPSTPTADPGNP